MDLEEALAIIRGVLTPGSAGQFLAGQRARTDSFSAVVNLVLAYAANLAAFLVIVAAETVLAIMGLWNLGEPVTLAFLGYEALGFLIVAAGGLLLWLFFSLLYFLLLYLFSRISGGKGQPLGHLYIFSLVVLGASPLAAACFLLLNVTSFLPLALWEAIIIVVLASLTILSCYLQSLAMNAVHGISRAKSLAASAMATVIFLLIPLALFVILALVLYSITNGAV